MVAFQDFFGFAGLQEDVFWDEFVFEYVVREFLLFVLLLYQILATTSGNGAG